MVNHLERYYGLHARFYDATPWAFLFGREELLRQVAPRLTTRSRGWLSGTGRNLRRFAELYAEASLTGVDLSPNMLAKAERKLSLKHVALGGHLLEELRRTAGQGTYKVGKAFMGPWRFFNFLSYAGGRSQNANPPVDSRTFERA